MAKLRIVKMGDDTLRKVCRPVDAVTPRIVTLLDDMIETMREADGCGLAAPQVGVLRRIAVVEVEPGEVYELITHSADVVKAVFAGHFHSDIHLSIRARTPDGEETVIPQFISTALAYGAGHMMRILVR